MHHILKVSRVPVCQLGSDARNRDSHRLAQERRREEGRGGNIVDKGWEGYLGSLGGKPSLTQSQKEDALGGGVSGKMSWVSTKY